MAMILAVVTNRAAVRVALAHSARREKDTPVTLPLGWLRLATSPAVTGSTPIVNTIGMVYVTALAAKAAGGPPVGMTATLRSTRSVAIVGSRS